MPFENPQQTCGYILLARTFPSFKERREISVILYSEGGKVEGGLKCLIRRAANQNWLRVQSGLLV